MVPTDLSAEQLEQEVPALEMVKGYNVSHLTIAKNIWNDKYGSLNDPSILGFSEKSKGDKDLSETL
jgi:hypothetical protein